MSEADNLPATFRDDRVVTVVGVTEPFSPEGGAFAQDVAVEVSVRVRPR